ncbi:MAG TPA: hypothetical protein VKD22_17120, partial [Ramlibacter sp.]|nr:hypothetical protein [Ramlibacter sp.]
MDGADHGGAHGKGGFAGGGVGLRSVVPATVRQLLGARPDATDGTQKVRVDGKECELVTLVARLAACDPVETGLSLTLDDGSGLLNAKVYGSGDEMRGIAVGSYVRVYGS